MVSWIPTHATRLLIDASTGAVFTSLTKTVKLLVWLRAGSPSSVTLIVIVFVLGPWASVGVQVSTPVVESTSTPAGPLTKAKVSVLAGTSVSVAVFVITSVLSSLMVWSAGTVRTGALFTSLTTTVKLLVALRAGLPLSVTLTVIVFVLGPCASVGVQLSTPLVGLTATPDGPLTKAKVSVLAGRSVSAAVFVTTSVLSSLIV